MKFAVIGGDMRIAHLCELLIHDGHEVRAFALEKSERAPFVICAKSVQDAVNSVDCVILPLPATGRKDMLNAPLSAGEFAVSDILRAVEPGTLVCAGRVDTETQDLARHLNINMIDYFKREELTVVNAIATAEGALGLIMQETPVTIWNSRVLVIGFGRIGKLLAHRLRGLCAEVTVSARNHMDKTWIQAYGYKALDTGELQNDLDRFDVIVNTAPALVLDESRLTLLKQGALCIDLASKPGGLDFAAASRLGVRAVWALSLPGEVAPVTSGMIIKKTIYNIVREQESEA